jgi:ABC-type bacteriocin/lantibiotic exporter with double-glycine peptidase domain
MFDPKYTQLIFSFFMALFMSCIMSLVITLYNVGFIDGIFFIWLKAWLFAFAVALPAINLVSPIVRRLVKILIKHPH